jgi:hypothetical protein
MLSRDAQFGSFMNGDVEALAALPRADFKSYCEHAVAPELADALTACRRLSDFTGQRQRLRRGAPCAAGRGLGQGLGQGLVPGGQGGSRGGPPRGGEGSPGRRHRSPQRARSRSADDEAPGRHRRSHGFKGAL